MVGISSKRGSKVTPQGAIATLRDMNPAELDRKIDELRAEVFHERGIVQTMGMGYVTERSGTIRPLKRLLARALTVKRERENARRD